MKVQKVLLCSFHCKPRPSGVSSDSSELENIAKVPENRAEFCQNHDARKAVSATFSAEKLESERSKSYAVSISLQSKALRK